MSKAYPRCSWAPVFSYFAVLSLAASGFSAELLPPGFRPLPLGVHALVGGKIVTKPGEVIDTGTIVIRDRFIKAVGKEVTPPPDARVWDMKGTTIYAGFIDAYLVMGTTNTPVATSDTEPISAASFTAAEPLRVVQRRQRVRDCVQLTLCSLQAPLQVLGTIPSRLSGGLLVKRVTVKHTERRVFSQVAVIVPVAPCVPLTRSDDND